MPPGKPVGAARHVRAGLGDPAAGAGLGRDQRRVLRCQAAQPTAPASCCSSTSVGVLMRQFYPPLAGSGPSPLAQGVAWLPNKQAGPHENRFGCSGARRDCRPRLTATRRPRTRRQDRRADPLQAGHDRQARRVRAEPAAHGLREPCLLADLRRVRRQGEEGRRPVPGAGRRLRRQVRLASPTPTPPPC